MEEKKTSRSGSGYEQLEKCVTENGARALQLAPSCEDFPFLQTEVAGIDWQTIVAKEYHYHRSCYRRIVRKREAKTAEKNEDKIMNEVFKHIEEKVINDCEVLRMTDISKKYSDLVEQSFGDEDRDVIVPKAQNLKEKLQRFFGNKIGFWRPSSGSELLFNDGVEKGQLVEVAVRAKLVNQKWDDKSAEEKTTEVAREIRKELLEAPPTYPRYVAYSLEKTCPLCGITSY